PITLLHSLAIFSTLHRLYHRYNARKLWWDDYVTLVPLLMELINVVVLWLQFINSGAFRYTKRKAILYYLLAIPVFFIIWFSRISLALSLVRVFPPNCRPRQFAIGLAAAFCMVFLLLISWELNLRCGDAAKLDPVDFIHCPIDHSRLAIAGVTFDIVADTLLIGSSLHLLWRVRLPANQRRLVLTLFSASILTLLSAVTLCACTFSPLIDKNPYPELIRSMIVHLEMAIALIVCNILVVVTCIYRRFRRIEDIERTASPDDFTSSKATSFSQVTTFTSIVLTEFSDDPMYDDFSDYSVNHPSSYRASNAWSVNSKQTLT
ncbi:hypothetical protein BDQ12DRAFT_604131, partial [Crucibulum laeve]